MAGFLGLPGGSEWIIILAIVLLLFGPSQLPKLMKSVGKAQRSFKEAAEGTDEDDEEEAAAPKAKSKKKAAADDEE